ncbi:unnamed protein product [Malus baccata var. baccata]
MCIPKWDKALTGGISEQVMNIVNGVYPYASSNTNEEGGDDGRPTMDSEEFKNYEKLLKNAKQELYPGCENFSVLSAIVELMHGKIKFHLSNKCFDYFLGIKKVLKGLGLGYEKIHACVNNCILFYKENKQLDKCPICNESRFKMTSQNRKTKIPQKVMRYLPLKPRLQRLYMLMHTATDMRWHKEGRVNDDVMRHPADGEAWKEFDRMYPDFATDPRNVRLGLATDGFNQFGVLNQNHSTWPVVLFPYNLPHWKCMKKEYMMLTLLMSEDLGKSINVYLRPLVNELKDLWENGVRTYDKYTRQMFTMRAAVMWTVHDFPAYAMVFGWMTKGYLACPICKENVTSSWHARKVCYLGHRRWLPWDNEWRQNDKAFHGTKETRLRPREWSGDEILDHKPRPTTHLNWTHKSMLFELPYWSKLKVRHNLDVMHIEKNVFDTLVGTILDIEGKTKDTIEARLDLERMGIRSSLWMQSVGGTLKKGHPFFTVKPNGKKEFFNFISSVKFPDGYASNISSSVNVKGCKFSNIKSHDCHVILQRLLPIFPPAFFTSMIHVMIHLPDEALLAGPVNCRWMYPIERYLIKRHTFYLCKYIGELKKCVRNRAKPEGSLVETAFNRPQRNNDCGVRKEKLSIFAQIARPFGDPIKGESFTKNDMEFLGATRDDKLSTQNSGVHVPGAGDSEDINFYGKLTSVVQLLYKDRCQVILFKCLWFDTNPHNRTSVKRDHGLLSVNSTRHWYDEDPYILATMAKQIFYLDDPKAGNGWKVLSSSIEIGEETLRDTNIVQEPFDIPGVPEFEISIDLGDLPQYNAPKEANENEDEWESGNDSSEDSDSYYCSSDED